MAIFKSIFTKKKDKNTDGQEEFFKDDFPPVVNRPSTKKPEENPVQQKKTAEPKNSTANKSTSPRVVVAPKHVSRIVNPKSAAAKEIVKKADAKAEKPIAKKSSTTKKTEAAKKPTTKTPAKKSNTIKSSKTPVKSVKLSLEKELRDDSPVVKDAVAIKESKESSNGKWDIRRAKDGRYFFSLYASNHAVIAYSQIYSSTTAVTTGINSVIANAAKAETEDTTLKKTVSLPCPKWEIYLDKAEQYRFRLYAPNGLIVCHSSHGYASKSGCKGGIESIKRFASEEATVDKSYLK